MNKFAKLNENYHMGRITTLAITTLAIGITGWRLFKKYKQRKNS